MAGLVTLAKMALGRGGLGKDELEEVLELAGFENPTMEQIDKIEVARMLTTADLAGENEKFFVLSGQMKSGEKVKALILVSPPPKVPSA